MAISLRSDLNSTNQNNATEHDLINLFMEKVESPFKSAFHYLQAFDHFTSGDSIKSLLSKTLSHHSLWKYVAFGGIAFGVSCVTGNLMSRFLRLGALLLLGACVSNKPQDSDSANEDSINDSQIDTTPPEDPCENPDEDGDGYDKKRCDGEDCNDNDSNINPGEDEITGNDVDENCNGSEDADEDGDGYTERRGDCDDENGSIYPGASDPKNDGIDSDCGEETEKVGCDGSEYDQIQASIDHASDGDTIVICEGTYYESIEITGMDLTLKAETEDASVTIKPEDDDQRVFEINTGSDVTISDLSIEDGYASESGGCILVDAAYLFLKRSDVLNCTARDSGGGVAVINGGSFRMDGGQLSSNYAYKQGGGLYVADMANIDFIGYTTDDEYTEFHYPYMRSNQASEGGGIALDNDVYAKITDLTLEDNTADYGAAMYMGLEAIGYFADMDFNDNIITADDDESGILQFDKTGSEADISADFTGDDGPEVYISNGRGFSFSISDEGWVKCSYDYQICE